MDKQLFVHGSAKGEGVPGAAEWARIVGHSDVRHKHGTSIASNGPGDLLIAAGFDEDANELPPILLPQDQPSGPAASLVCLDKTGRERWRRRFGVHAQGESAPRAKVPTLALDNDGSSWLVGKLRLTEGASPTLEAADDWSLTSLDPRGVPVWSQTLPFVDPHSTERPRVVAHPEGGTAITSYDWSQGALFVVRCDVAGRVLWTQRITMSHPHEGEITDLRIGVDRKGHLTAWGQFCGSLNNADGPLCAEPSEQARFVVRFDSHGPIRWARKKTGYQSDGMALAVLGSGCVVVAERAAALTDSHPNRATSRDLLVSVLSAADGALFHEARYTGGPHTVIGRAVVAPTGDKGFVCGGYFNGEIYTGSKQSIKSGSEEWLFLGGSKTWWRAFRGVALQGGLRVCGDASGAKIVAGWFAGTIDVGGRLTSTDRAGLFVARFAT